MTSIRYVFYKFISDFIPFSPNLVANHTPISSITPPCYLDPPHTPRPWRPQLGSSDPDSDMPSPSHILSPVCRNSKCLRHFWCGYLSCWVPPPPPPPSSEWRANYVICELLVFLGVSCEDSQANQEHELPRKKEPGLHLDSKPFYMQVDPYETHMKERLPNANDVKNVFQLMKSSCAINHFACRFTKGFHVQDVNWAAVSYALLKVKNNGHTCWYALEMSARWVIYRGLWNRNHWQTNEKAIGGHLSVLLLHHPIPCLRVHFFSLEACGFCDWKCWNKIQCYVHLFLKEYVSDSFLADGCFRGKEGLGRGSSS